MKKTFEKNARGVEYCRCKKPQQEVTSMKGPMIVYCGKCGSPMKIK